MSSHLSRFLFGTTSLLVLSLPAFSATYTVTNPSDDGTGTTPGTLSNAIVTSNTTAGSNNIIFSVPEVTLNFASPQTTLPPITEGMTIGNPSSPVTIAANRNRAFFVFSGSTVTIQNIDIVGAGTHAASGGTVLPGEGGGGGGGVGAGPALWVNSGTTVILSNVNFINNLALGGNGGDSENLQVTGAAGGGGGGGAFDGGNGGIVMRGLPSGGGGGGGAFPSNSSNNGAGGSGSSLTGGVGSAGTAYASLLPVGSGGGGGGGGGSTGGDGGMGGDGTSGGITVTTAGGGGGGGTTGSNSNLNNGGDGGSDGGGGGGGTNNSFTGGTGGNGGSLGGGGGGGGTSAASGGTNHGGSGGFGGGGGGGGIGFTAQSSPANGGQGGIGGGGGGGGGSTGGAVSVGGQSLYGGGSGGNADASGIGPFGGGGGGGAGLGGAIFVHQSANLIIDVAAGFSGNSAAGGRGGVAFLAHPGSPGVGHGLDIFLTGGGSSNVTFDISSDVEIPNPIESNPGGIASFTKTGLATLTLNGANTYSTGSGTQVQQGTLVINGSVSDSVIVAAGAILAGNAAMFNLTSAGTVSPGNSIGIMNVQNYSTTGKYQVEVDANGNADLLIASETATLSNILDVTALPGDYPTEITYNILHAGHVSGTFNHVVFHNNSSLPFNSLQVIYTSTDVYLLLKFAGLDIGGLTGVAKKIAESFVAIPLKIASDATFVNDLLLQLSLPELQKAFTRMNPAIFSALTIAQESNGIMVRSAFTRHLEQLHSMECRTIERDTFNFWVDPVGQWQYQSSTEHQVGFNTQTGGVVAGLDRLFTPELCAGLSGGWTYTHMDWDKIADGNIKSSYGGVYGSWLQDDYYVDLTAFAGRNHYHASRHIQFPGLDRRARNHHSGYEVVTSLSGGYFFRTHDYQIQPLARFDYVFLHQNAYEEKHAKSLNFKIHSKNAQLLRSEIGLDVLRCFATKRGKWIPEIKVSYVNESQLGDRHYVGRFTESIVTFTLNGWNPDRNMVAPSAAFTYLTSDDRFSLSAHYDAEIGSHYWSQEASIHFDMRF